MKVLVYLDGRVQELEEENQILKKREERVRHLQVGPHWSRDTLDGSSVLEDDCVQD